MKPAVPFRHLFVESVPEQMEEGVVYISIRFRTAMHLCACGCKAEVVTPLSPTDWHLTFDGVSVSLDPSVGNWSLPCRSHYFIRRNKAVWAGDWSEERIAAGRARDRDNKERYCGKADGEARVDAPGSQGTRGAAKAGFVERALDFLFGKSGGK